MRHNNVVSSHPKSTGILRVDELSTGLSDLRCHRMRGTQHNRYPKIRYNTVLNRGAEAQIETCLPTQQKCHNNSKSVIALKRDVPTHVTEVL